MSTRKDKLIRKNIRRNVNDLTEQEFRESAGKKGIRKENIDGFVESFYFVKEKQPDLNLKFDEELVTIVLNLQEKEDNTPDGMVSLD